ncbi:MAG: transposase [Polyangiales bacterium]
MDDETPPSRNPQRLALDGTNEDGQWFVHALSRSKDVVHSMLGARFEGVIHSDLYGAYFIVDGAKHAVCSAFATIDLLVFRTARLAGAVSASAAGPTRCRRAR